MRFKTFNEIGGEVQNLFGLQQVVVVPNTELNEHKKQLVLKTSGNRSVALNYKQELYDGNGGYYTKLDPNQFTEEELLTARIEQ